jgi:hypothetical protein
VTSSTFTLLIVKVGSGRVAELNLEGKLGVWCRLVV